MIWLAEFYRSGSTIVANLLKDRMGQRVYSISHNDVFPVWNGEDGFVRTHGLPDGKPSIYVYRDPRDVAVSWHSFTGQPYSIAYRWGEHVKAWIDKADLVFKYEDIDQLDVLEKLSSYLGIKAEMKTLPDFEEYKRNFPKHYFVGKSTWETELPVYEARRIEDKNREMMIRLKYLS